MPEEAPMTEPCWDDMTEIDEDAEVIDDEADGSC